METSDGDTAPSPFGRGPHLSSPLEKARKDPESMKARILAAAKLVFGKYGFHGTTTRSIAKEVGIDISTLYYHWGEKSDLYEAVLMDITEDLRQQLRRVEKIISGKPLAQRLDIAIDRMTDYLFDRPEIANLILFRYFTKTRHKTSLDIRVPEVVSDIARSMGLQDHAARVTDAAKMQVLGIMNAIYNFVSGEDYFRSMLEMDRAVYIPMVKETLKFLLIPAFAGVDPEGKPAGETGEPIPA